MDRHDGSIMPFSFAYVQEMQKNDELRKGRAEYLC